MSCMPSTHAFHPSVVRPVVVPGIAAITDALAEAESPAARRRPKLLIRAAKAGQANWRRHRDLPKVLGSNAVPGSRLVLSLLEAEEAHLNDARRARAADYSIERHVLVLIALLAELRAAVHGEEADEAPPAVPTAEVIPFTGRGTTRPARP